MDLLRIQKISCDHIRLHNQDDHCLKTWKIEGSVDKQKWFPLDSQTNNNKLKVSSHVHISNKENKQMKYIRYQQTGPNWFQNDDIYHYLKLNSIEFYGVII